jgi:hypothetical protein
MTPSLPKNTLTKTGNNRGDIAAFARYFVTKELADTMPEASLDTTLDLVIGLKALRSYYVDYLNQMGQASVELSNIKHYLSAENWQALNNEKRRYLEICIAKEVEQINASVQRAIDWLNKQLIQLNPGEAKIAELMERRVKQYPTYAPQPMRKARRIKQAAGC